jgi:hypothetical protein
MEKNESIERFVEGLSKASDRARQLAKAQKNSSWLQVAINLDELCRKGRQMYASRQISRQDALGIADQIVSRTVN